MAEYTRITCSCCTNEPLSTCDGCGKRLCYACRVATWPDKQTGIRRDYCAACWPTVQSPAP